MNCIEARRMVTPFVKKELSDKEMEQFLKHIESCSDCMDELDIYFTMYRALDSLDSGAHHEFNFKKMLENDIRAAKHGIARRKALRNIRWFLLILAEACLMISVYTGYEMKQGEVQESTFQRAIYRLHAVPSEVVQETEETKSRASDLERETEESRTKDSDLERESEDMEAGSPDLDQESEQIQSNRIKR